MATISDVARLSGISVSTVSRVINDSPHVSPDKRARVLAAMEQLGYTPLQAARQMRGSGSGNIAVFVPTITNPFFAYLVNSIERTCRERDYKTMIIQTYGKKESEIEALDLLKFHHVDGAILCALENDAGTIRRFAKYGSIVICNEYNGDESIPSVQGRQYEGFLEATEYLIGKGHKSIAYCTGSRMVALQELGKNVNSDRYRGYAEAMSNHGLAMNPAFIYTNVRTFEDGQAFIREYARLENRPDAVISGSDQVAAGMVFEAGRQGVRVPDELAILGMDDQPIATQVEPALTTIRQPIDDEGRLAAEELLGMLLGRDGKTTRQRLDLTLVVRQSA